MENESNNQNNTLEQAEKWFERFSKMPIILYWTIVVLFFIWGIVDEVAFKIQVDKWYNGYSYGIMRLPSGFLCWFIWQLIGQVVGFIWYVALKLSLSYKVLHIAYLKRIYNLNSSKNNEKQVEEN